MNVRLRAAWALCLVAVVLSGCVGGMRIPPEGTAFIEVYSGNGTFSGFAQKTVYSDDTVVVAFSGEGGRGQRRTVTQAPPGLYDKVVALVAAEGPSVRVTAPGDAHLCLDYGEDRVTAQPAIGGFSSISASCPEPAMTDFATRVLNAIAVP